MRISVTHGTHGDGGVLAPIDPPPVSEIDDLFELVRFDASPRTFTPFHDVVVSWEIVPRTDDVGFEDYVFSLVTTEGTAVEELESATGSAVLHPTRNTLVRIRGRRRLQGRGVTTLGQGLALTADTSDCITREIPSFLLDALFAQRVADLTSSTASLRTRGNEEVVADWGERRIRYRLPLELVLNNFFNGDVDITLELTFRVHHDDDESELEVTIDHDSDANFHFLEDIASVGTSAIVAKTLRKMLPLLLDCITSKVEEIVVRQMVTFIRPLLSTHRLLMVDIVPAGNLSYLSLVLCPLPERD